MNNKINYLNQNIAFKSRIVFLSPKGLSNVVKKYKNIANICNFEITGSNMGWYNCYKLNVKRGYTQGVRTCTAGVCINKGENAPIFWHVENTLKNLERFPMLTNFIKGTKSSEADLFYDAEKDTLYLCLHDVKEKSNYVRSMQDLHQSCDIVKISPTDSVEFCDFLPKQKKKWWRLIFHRNKS